MTALTKADIADKLFSDLNVSKTEAKEMVDSFFEEIRSCLVGGEEVKLSGFGNFEVRQKKQRPGRNPKTGEEVAISARRVVSFKAGRKLKEKVERSRKFAAGNFDGEDTGEEE